MKNLTLFIVASSIAIATGANSDASLQFRPYRISYDTLVSSDDFSASDQELFLDALTSTGVVSITSLPADAKQAAQDMSFHQHACLMESESAQEQTFSDGTVRRTLATHTVAGVGGMQPLKYNSAASEACAAFEKATIIFRKASHVAVTAFAATLSNLLNVQEPLLVTQTDHSNETNNDEPYSFHTFSDVVENGEHLEHFHSYQKITQVSTSTGTSTGKTIDLHTDQGLFLAFTPGHLTTGELTKGFFIQTVEGSIQQVDFTKNDELVIMLGDGVNQYVNEKIVDSDKKLRAVPHALQLEHHAQDQARVWYGLMVLPPAAAVHPAHGTTFGQIRQGLMLNTDEALRLACSQDGSPAATSIHRMLEGDETTTCENSDELYCWHRCMNTTVYQVSEAQCDETFQTLQCVNPRGQIAADEGDKHGDYFPGCVDSDGPIETAFPTLPNYPRDDAACTGFDEFVAQETYANSVTLEGGNGAVFQYTVQDGKVMGRLAFNGIFGYLSIGFAGTGGRNNMLNGHIIMALPGSEYSARTGLDLSTDHSVNEYVIDPVATSFRIWGETPYMSGSTATERSSGLRHLASTYSVQSDSCFSALTFQADAIANQTFNLGGIDKMMWAANNVDTFVQYHGQNRGVFTIDWSEDASTEETGDGIKVKSTSGAASIQAMGVLVVALVAAAFL